MLKDGELTGRIINACMEVHKELGNGFLEAVYQEALETEFKLQGIPYEREKEFSILYKGKILSKRYYTDFFCFNKIVVELKALPAIKKEHKSQVINYLKASDCEIGLIFNFGCKSLKWDRISVFDKTETGEKVSMSSVSE